MARAIDPDSKRGEHTEYRGRLAVDTYTSFSTAIVRAIATVRAEDLIETDIDLYDYVDPEALDTLYQHSQYRQTSRWALSFAVDELMVTVQSDGYIEIR